ncbi:flippase [Corynebacterium hindlerae]|uniref:flippase n=1 Tax=Corynebacterium hindlerae TaxID=699041 RepID=UPI003AAAAD11
MSPIGCLLDHAQWKEVDPMAASHQNQRKDLARGGSLSFVGSAFSAGMGFVLTVIVSRMLGAEGAGLFFQVTGIFAMILAFAKFGMDSTSIYLIPRVKVDDPPKVFSAALACVGTALGVSILLTVVVEAFSPILWAEANDVLLHAVRLVILLVPFGAVMLTVAAILRSLGSVLEYVLISNIALPLLRPVFVVVAILCTGSIAVVSVAWAVPFVLLSVIAGTLVMRHIKALEGVTSGSRLPSQQRWLEVWRFATPRTLSAGLEQALAWLPVLMIGWLLSDQAAGVFGGAARFIQAGLLVDAALRVVVSPKFSALLHRKQNVEVSELYVTASIWLVLLASPAYVLLGIFSPVFLGLFGQEFVPGALSLSILALGMAVTFMAGNIHSLLIMSGRSGWAAANKAVVLLICVVGNLVLIPAFGLPGAAMVWLVCQVLDAVLAAVEVRVFLGISMQPLEVLRPLIVVLLSFGLPACAGMALWGNSLVALCATGGGGLAFYCVLCWKLREELQLDGLSAMLRSR